MVRRNRHKYRTKGDSEVEYNVNVISNGKKTVLPCSQYTVTEVDEGSPAATLELDEPGIHIMLGDNPDNCKWVHLPEDGEAVFITNQGGKTIDSYRWPKTPATNRKEMRQ